MIHLQGRILRGGCRDHLFRPQKVHSVHIPGKWSIGVVEGLLLYARPLSSS